jgi:hypothetical protein
VLLPWLKTMSGDSRYASVNDSYGVRAMAKVRDPKIFAVPDRRSQILQSQIKEQERLILSV